MTASSRASSGRTTNRPLVRRINRAASTASTPAHRSRRRPPAGSDDPRAPLVQGHPAARRGRMLRSDVREDAGRRLGWTRTFGPDNPRRIHVELEARCLSASILARRARAAGSQHRGDRPHADIHARFTRATPSLDVARAGCRRVLLRIRMARITINGGQPLVGRSAIADMAKDFYSAFPDLVVPMDDVGKAGDNAISVWTLEGTHAKPATREGRRLGGVAALRRPARARVARAPPDASNSIDRSRTAPSRRGIVRN